LVAKQIKAASHCDVFSFNGELKMSITVNAVVREDQGKGASRRLRKEEKVPGIIYGGKNAPTMITVDFHEITHLLENEDSFTSVLDLVVGKSKESVIIKDLQRHPAKNTINHIDFLRVDAKHAIVTTTPLHFIGEEDNEALRVGALLNQFVVAIEISCLPKDMPHGIDVDVSGLAIGDHISLTGLVLPEGVTITALQHDDVEAHDQTVVSVSEARVIEEEEEDFSEAPVAPDAEDSEGGEEASEDGDSEA